MPGTLSRTLLTLILLLSTPVVCAILSFCLQFGFGFNEIDLLTFTAVWGALVYMMVGWSKIWEKQIVWTSKRKDRTQLVTVTLIIVAVIVSVLIALLVGVGDHRGWVIGHVIGGVFFLFSWPAATILVWTETPEERIKRTKTIGIEGVVCPSCDYNMAGLNNTVCPECGSKYTIDQIVAHVIESKRDVLAEE